MKRKIIKIIVIAATVIVALTGVFVPGIILSVSGASEHNVVEMVPEKYYSASNMAIARNASANLTADEKLQLVTGTWESTISETSEAETNISLYKAVTLARNGVESLYKSDKFPVSITSDYENWYNWEACVYKAVDKTFNTYTAYYYEITFEKYDGSEVHVVKVTEDGIVFYAEASWTDGSQANFIYDASK